MKFCKVTNKETRISYIGVYLYEDKYSISLLFPEKDMGGFNRNLKEFSKSPNLEYEVFEIMLGFEIGIQEQK